MMDQRGSGSSFHGAGNAMVRPMDVFPPEGIHLIVDAWGGDYERLNDRRFLSDLLVSAASSCGATLLKVESFHFEPNGVTAIAILAESHASLHTYPDHGVIMIDAFTCGSIDPDPLIRSLVEGVRAERHVVRRAARGDRAPLYIEEALSPGQTRIWDLHDIVARERTDFQDVLIARTDHGLTLFCNDERQSSELTQLIYHEGQFVPAALLADHCRTVLIVGSSEGVVTQLAQWCGAERIVHADIDRRCVELCAQHLPYGYTPGDLVTHRSGRSGVELLYEDGAAVVDRYLECGDRFDVIVIDLPDEEAGRDAQHNRLYEQDFLLRLKRLLRPGGAVIAQAGCASYWRNTTLTRALKRFRSVFASAVYFEMTEQDWVWVVGTEAVIEDPVTRMRNALASLPYAPSYIDAETIGAATVIPLGLRRLIETSDAGVAA